MCRYNNIIVMDLKSRSNDYIDYGFGLYSENYIYEDSKPKKTKKCWFKPKKKVETTYIYYV